MIMENVNVSDDEEEQQEHDQLPSVEEVKVGVIPAATTSSSRSWRLLSGLLCGIVVALAMILVMRSVVIGGSTPRRYQTQHLNADQIDFVVQLAARESHLNAEFADRSTQQRALQQVQKRTDLTTSTEALQLYALWSLSLATHRVRTDVTDEQYGLGTYPNWVDSWMDDGEDWCLWYGVRCDGNKEVVELHLDDNNLTGELPKELTLLSTLTTLNLRGNKGLGQGGVPSWLADIPTLKEVDLQGCSYVHGANALCEALSTASTSTTRDDWELSTDCPTKIPCDCCKCGGRD